MPNGLSWGFAVGVCAVSRFLQFLNEYNSYSSLPALSRCSFRRGSEWCARSGGYFERMGAKRGLLVIFTTKSTKILEVFQ